MAKPYREGSTWSVRVRAKGTDTYLGGHPTSRAAQKAATDHLRSLEQRGKPVRQGPERTTLGQALSDAALERLPFLKGARQEVGRVNRYLRLAGLPVLRLTDQTCEATGVAPAKRGRPAAHATKRSYFEVTVGQVVVEDDRPVPNGLRSHRQALLTQSATSDRHRARLAATPVASVTRHQIQQLIDAMQREGAEPATLDQERSLLRTFFNHARKCWAWAAPGENPAQGLRMPTIEVKKQHVVTAAEQALLDSALAECRNALVAPVVSLLLESGMRTSEPLDHAVWGDVDYVRCVLTVRDAKTGTREVPLSPKAILALRTLQGDQPRAADERLVEISYESLKAAWVRCVQRAGLGDLRLYDLRHTAATRMALRTGNVFLVQALTGHKTLSQLQRYVNVAAADAVAVLHAQVDDDEGSTQSPASSTSSKDRTPIPAEAGQAASDPLDGLRCGEPPIVGGAAESLGGNVVRVAFGHRRSA